MRLRKEKKTWSALRYIVYFTQVGLTMVTPPLLCSFGGLWLRDKFGWGNWIVIFCILLGVAIACVGLRDFLRLTQREAQKNERKANKP